jgi:hypothetical protein
MYFIELWMGPNKRLKQSLQFSTLEAFILWERDFDWETRWYNGELHGFGEHKGWYAVKINGAWTLNYQESLSVS